MDKESEATAKYRKRKSIYIYEITGEEERKEKMIINK
jgi:hypothetical protein